MENNQQHHQQNPKRQKISSLSSFSNTNSNGYRRRKGEVCFKFQRGICNYGSRCCFIHTTNAAAHHHLIKPSFSKPPSSRIPDTCPSFPFKPKLEPYNNNNNNNNIIIISIGDGMPWRKRLCHSWVSFGTCKYGSNCFFAHGDSELQKRGSSNAEGVSCKWVDKTCEKEVKGMRWEFKWDVDKISRVYGDWITDTPLVHVDTGSIPT